MVHHQEQEQTPESTIQDTTDNVKRVTTKPHQELGKSFASRKIQVAALAIRSSHSASQSPLFLKHDMYRLYQQPFVASSLSTPTNNTRSSIQIAGEKATLPRSSLPSHLLSTSTLLDSNDRALFDKTWSVLAPKSDSNQQQQRKKARRRVTFNDQVEFFDPPPPIDYYDHPPFPSSSSPIKDKIDQQHQVIEKENLVNDSGNSMSPPPPPLPQYSGYWADQYTNSTENSSSLPEPQMADIPLKHHQASKPMSSVSSASSTSTSSTSSSLSLSISSSSTQTNSINNNSNDMIHNRSSPFFNQRLNASTSSLPAYQSTASSNLYNVTPASASAAALAPSSTNQMALQRKGNKISRHAILQILENRAPHAGSPNHRRSVKDNKRLSLQQQTSNSTHHTLDSVQHEIRQAIARAQASNIGNPLLNITNTPAPPETDDTHEQMVKVKDVETCTAEEDDTPMQNIDDNNNQSSSGDDSSDSSTTIPGADNDKVDNGHDSDSFSQDWNTNDVALMVPTDQDASSQDMVGTHGDQILGSTAMDGLLVYFPSSDDTLSNFGDTLLNEFDRISGDLMDDSNADTATGEMQPVPPNNATESCSNLNDKATDEDDTINDEPSKHNVPWRILGPQNDSAATLGQEKPLGEQKSQNATTNGRLYIKIIAAENLDFPINQGAPSIQCSVNDGNQYLGSGHYKMQHNIHFNHEFILNDMAPDGEFTLTLHAIRPGDQTDNTTAKRWSRRSSFTNKHDDLTRYISAQDGSLAQTRVSLKSISYQCRTKLCTASFALVNGWYQPAKTGHHPLFLSKAQRGKRNVPVQEKAVGKITIELFYLPNADDQIPDLPTDIDSCENALNVQRFHQTVWRYGYMSQLGGDVKFWRRRYFKLIGGHLYSNTDTSQSPRTMIDLSKAVALASDNRIILEAKNQQKPQRTIGCDAGQDLLLELESQINSPYHQQDHNGSRNTVGSIAALSSESTLPLMDDAKADDDLSSYSVKNSFQLKFDNGDKIEFFCDSTFERERWLDVLKVILGRIPTLPSWLSV